jgi:hypothetical protein
MKYGSTSPLATFPRRQPFGASLAAKPVLHGRNKYSSIRRTYFNSSALRRDPPEWMPLALRRLHGGMSAFRGKAREKCAPTAHTQWGATVLWALAQPDDPDFAGYLVTIVTDQLSRSAPLTSLSLKLQNTRSAGLLRVVQSAGYQQPLLRFFESCPDGRSSDRLRDEKGPIRSRRRRQFTSLASSRAVDVGCHERPRGVRMPRAFSSAVTKRNQ